MTLITLDFPALERPIKAISRPLSSGASRNRGELLIKLA